MAGANLHPNPLSGYSEDYATDQDAAEADLKAYAHNLARFGGEACCLAIEEAWGLAGYPPEIVSTVLAAVADGEGVDSALLKALEAQDDR